MNSVFFLFWEFPIRFGHPLARFPASLKCISPKHFRKYVRGKCTQKIALPEQKRDKSDSIIVNWNVI